MKYLLVLLVIGLALWLWRRNGRVQTHAKEHAEKNEHSRLKTMARCVHCGVHLPDADAIKGSRGQYCSDAHRVAAED